MEWTLFLFYPNEKLAEELFVTIDASDLSSGS